ncbi:MAG: CvpA family protein [Candidatus Dormibacteraeota bacterium]|nr:CvpA family protein [Candidatus Dormibacteraeota bacterium]
MVLDILFALIILVAVVIGYKRGLVQPVLAELFFLGTALFLLGNGKGFAGFLERAFHLNGLFIFVVGLAVTIFMGYLGGRLGGIIHRMPVVQGVDGLLGLFLHGFVAILFCYFLLSALLAFNNAFRATAGAAAVTYAQVESLKRQLAANPVTAALMPTGDVRKLETQAQKNKSAQISETPLLAQLQTASHDFLEPQLTGSRLAPLVLRIGSKVPILSHATTRDLPTPAPVATPSPGPTPKR